MVVTKEIISIIRNVIAYTLGRRIQLFFKTSRKNIFLFFSFAATHVTSHCSHVLSDIHEKKRHIQTKNDVEVEEESSEYYCNTKEDVRYYLLMTILGHVV